MSQPLDICPKCGVLLSGVKCEACGYVGGKTEFIKNNNRCPKCGSKAHIPGGKTEALTCLALIVIVVVLIFAPKIAQLLRKPDIPATSALSIRVPPNYNVSHIPICDTALKDGKIKGKTYLCMVSDNGDLIGRGKTRLADLSSSTFKVSYLNINSTPGAVVRVVVVSPNIEDPFFDLTWNMQFERPTNLQFTAGGYENVLRGADSQHAGLDISGDGNRCKTVTGNFEILELVFSVTNESSTVEAFSANFEQHCNGEAPALRGYIRFLHSANTP
jgi:hypothetical protein